MESCAPDVSVVIPVYNSEEYIEDTVKSVLGQTFDSFEIVLVDDCSTDNTYKILQKMSSEDDRIKLIKNNSNLGVAKSRNRGIDSAAGKYIAFIDSDDLWYPGKLECQIKAMEENDADFVYCSYDIIDTSGKSCKQPYVVPTYITYEELLKENVIGCSTVLVKKEIIEQYKFRTEFYHEDYVLWLELLRSGARAVGCDEVLASWRYICESRSYDKKSSAKERWNIYRKFCNFSLFRSSVLMFSYAAAALRKYR